MTDGIQVFDCTLVVLTHLPQPMLCVGIISSTLNLQVDMGDLSVLSFRHATLLQG